MKAAIYVRVSTEDQARHGYSLSAQVEACRGRAASLGAAEVLTFADEGVSGALLARPGLDGLRDAVRARMVDVVVLWDPDRLSRNLSHQLLLTEEIERARIRLEFVNFEWKATPEGQLFYALRGAIAQYEKEKIKERTGRGRLQKAKQGKLPLAFRPYGYDYDAATALLVPNAAEERTVRDIYRRFIADGEGPNAIARRLNELGVPARKGGQWQRAVVRQILANPVYTGVFYANRWDAAGVSLNRHRPRAERVSPSLRPEAEWLPVAVPALVAADEWQRAQALLASARRLWAGRPRAEYLLSGLVVCGRCGRSMSGCAGTDWGVRRRRYSCRRPAGGGPGPGPGDGVGPGAGDGREPGPGHGAVQGAAPRACGRTVPAEPLEAAIWGELMHWLGDPDQLLAALADPERAAPARGGELAAVAEAVARAERGRASVISILEQDLMPPAEAAAALQRIQVRLAELEGRRAELAAAEAAVGAVGTGRPDPATWHAQASAAMARFRAGAAPEPAQRRLLVRTLVTRVVVGEGTAQLHALWQPER